MGVTVRTVALLVRPMESLKQSVPRGPFVKRESRLLVCSYGPLESGALRKRGHAVIRAGSTAARVRGALRAVCITFSTDRVIN